MSADPRTRMLVELAKQIARIATQNEKEYCIGSGFCIDFSLGRITRPHEDIDLVIDVRDTDWWKTAFGDLGYTVSRYDYMAYFPDAFTVGGDSEEDFLVEVWPMEFRPDGTLYPPHTPDHPGREWWIRKRHTDIRQVRFEGVAIRIEDPNVAIDQKLDHVRHHKEPLSPKHQHDARLMNRLDEYVHLVRELGLED